MPSPPLHPQQRVAQLVEGLAVEVDAAANRLRALGLSSQADKTDKAARALAVVCRSITGKPSETLALFFGVGEESQRAIEASMLPENLDRAAPAPYIAPALVATDVASVASTNRPQRVPADPVRHPNFLHVRRVSG